MILSYRDEVKRLREKLAELTADADRLRKLLGRLAEEYQQECEHAGGVAPASLVYQEAAQAAKGKPNASSPND